MIRQKITPPLMTSVPMVVGAVILTVVYVTLSLWYSAAVETTAIILWGKLMEQGLRNRASAAILSR
jgi:hypothetical protein